MPRSTSNSRPVYKPTPVRATTTTPVYAPQKSPMTVHHQVQQPGLFGSMVQGFGLGMGSSIARNMFEHKPVYQQQMPNQDKLPPMSPISSKVEVIDNKKIEFKQCMEKTYNSYEDCIHHLE